MSQYIHADNQTMLWEALCATALFGAWAAPAADKARFFREKVGAVYNDRRRFQSHPLRLAAPELEQMNRATIAGVVESLQALRASRPDAFRQAGPPPAAGGAVMRSFDERAREYDAVRAPPAPKEIQFAVDAAEGPIENMEELVQRHLRERDMDMHAYAAPPAGAADGRPAVAWSGVAGAEAAAKPANDALLAAAPATDAALARVEAFLARMQTSMDNFNVGMTRMQTRLDGVQTSMDNVQTSLDALAAAKGGGARKPREAPAA